MFLGVVVMAAVALTQVTSHSGNSFLNELLRANGYDGSCITNVVDYCSSAEGGCHFMPLVQVSVTLSSPTSRWTPFIYTIMTYTNVCRCVCLSVCFSVNLSLCMSVNLSGCLCVCVCVCLSLVLLSVTVSKVCRVDSINECVVW